MARELRRRVDRAERVWRAELEGSDIRFTTGQVGGRQRVRVVPHASAEDAARALAEAVQQMEAAGWEAVTAVPTVSEGVDPDDVTQMAVLADALTEAGDPRGALVSLQLLRERSGVDDPVRDRVLHAEERALFAAHGAGWTGDQAGIHGLTLTWRRGFLHTIVEEDVEGPGPLQRLLESGSARFLRGLVLRGSLEAVADVLVGSAWPVLERLELVGPSLVRPIADLVAGMPGLRELVLDVPTVDLVGLASGSLESLVLRVQTVDVEVLAGADLPTLRTVELSCADPWSCDRAALQRFFDRDLRSVVLADGAVVEWLQGLVRRPRTPRVVLRGGRARGHRRPGEVGWWLLQRRELLAGLPVAVEGIELSGEDLAELEGLSLELELPDVAVDRGLDRVSPRQEVWRRFERAKTGRFWSIVRAGEAVEVRYGKCGSAGRSERKVLPTVQAAAAEYRKRVNRKLAEGWEEVNIPPTP